VQRKQKPKHVMVWAGVTFSGKTPLFFVPEGITVTKESYMEFLESKVLPWASAHFGQQHWTFQQDSAPAHKAIITQNWIKSHFPDFISTTQWPSCSPDLNPLDYSIWGILEKDACANPHNSLEALKTSLEKAWASVPLDIVKNVVDNFPKRLRLCVEADGGHFEQK
jgi:inhibitor of nuclear factor kappa-B kinase subunit alpha